MPLNSIPRSTWIILGAMLLVLAILTGVFVTNSLRQEGPISGGVQILVGRSYEPDRSTPTKPVPACELLSQDELATILGRQVGSGIAFTSDNPLAESICIFPDPEDPEHTLAQIGIVYTQGMAPFLVENGYTVEQLFDGRNLGGGQTENVDDVGDKAFWGGSGQEIWNGLQVLVWDIYLDIDISSGDPDADLQHAKTVAGTILARLYPPR
jgi:hypothetical protein